MKSYWLEQQGLDWNFKSETELENFIFDNLTNLFNLTPIKRQYYLKGLYCDILAHTTDQQLVILELKIVQDRYIVQQLTRYFHYLKNHNDLGDLVDFAKPVKLIGILPSIHPDNLIDIQYHQLDFELYEYSIQTQNYNYFYFECSNIANKIKLPVLEIVRHDIKINTDLPPIPSKLKTILGKSSQLQYQGILKTREQILSFDNKIKEEVESNHIIYRFNKKIPVAEIGYGNNLRLEKVPILFLWLPFTKNLSYSTIVDRMMISTDWCRVSDLFYNVKGNGNTMRAKIKRFDLIFTGVPKLKEYLPSPIIPINIYFDYLRTIYEKLENADTKDVAEKFEKLKISSNIKNFNKTKYQLSEVVNFGLNERKKFKT
ncbi:endonuclease NucS [Spirulina subsalsa FACHB-351]|uniref:Endonuclease NucS n=1 Tax=Spirulina subsalsa FACHB-351 TaxID=234711 RepID=A0ABT3LAJ5_9CYAN|nr:endonuclease NucS domain-containing protein [Spirulina subsalsa]MCW6038526.1 endonuclease NucS [Spirulina subsalsa FACHB-351]